MPLFIRKFLRETFASDNEVSSCPNGWNVYGKCSDDNESNCLLLLEFKEADNNKAKHYYAAMAKFMKYSCSGRPLHQQLDTNRLHEAFCYTSDITSTTTTVWRFRNHDERVYFIYGSNKSIFILGCFEKHTDKLSTTHKKSLIKTAETYIKAQHYSDLKLATKNEN